MGVAIVQAYPELQSLYQDASNILGFDLLKTCTEGPEEKLRETNIAQPALFVTGLAAANVLQAAGVQPHAAAGHSIGEYAALVAAGVLSFGDALKLVKERGRLMQLAGQTRPGGMAAILGMEASALETLCSAAKPIGICVPVNYNSPEQIVIAGEVAALQEVCKRATEAGAKRVIPLNVAGAFHSPLMSDAAATMTELLKKTTFNDARFPVAMNVDGKLHTQAEDIRQTLSLQLNSPVRWTTAIETLAAYGITTFIECGAGRVLSGLLRRINKQLEFHSTETPEALRESLDALLHRRPA